MKKKEIAKIETEKGFQPIRAALDQAFSEIDRLHSGEKFESNTGKGLAVLDDVFFEHERPRFSIISVPIRSGETTDLGGSISAELSRRFNRKIGYFSMQASSLYYSSILLSAVSNVNFRMIRTGKLPKELWPRLSLSAGNIAESDIYINDTRLQSTKTIRKSVRELIKGSEIDLIVIDNLQHISIKNKYRKKARGYQKICRSLMDISIELNVSILLLSQFSGEYNPDRIEVSNDCQSLPFVQDYGNIADAELCLIPRTQDSEDRLFNLYIYYNREGPTETIRLRQNLGGGCFKTNYIY